jgi:hypothetical protein
MYFCEEMHATHDGGHRLQMLRDGCYFQDQIEDADSMFDAVEETFIEVVANTTDPESTQQGKKTTTANSQNTANMSDVNLFFAKSGANVMVRSAS